MDKVKTSEVELKYKDSVKLKNSEFIGCGWFTNEQWNDLKKGSIVKYLISSSSQTVKIVDLGG